MENMDKQRKLIEYEVEIPKIPKPEIKIVKNRYSTAGGLVEEILIRKFYHSKAFA